MLKDAHSKLGCSQKPKNITRSSEIKGEQPWGNRRLSSVIACFLLAGTLAIEAQPARRPTADSLKKPTITPAIKNPCQDLEQKLSKLESQGDQLNAKINAAKANLTMSNKREVLDKVKEYEEQLKQVEKNIKTTQAALDECRTSAKRSPTPGYVATGKATPCPDDEVVPSPSPSATVWEDNAFRHIDGNGIPNHCVAKTYHAPIKAQNYHFKVPLNPELPEAKGSPTPVTVCPTPFSKPPQRFGVALNSVPFDPEDVAIWTETGASPLCGGPKVGDCIDNFAVQTAEDCPPNKVRWQLDAGATIDPSLMCCPEAQLEMDDHTAHTQNENRGIYHYHTLTQETAAAIAGVSETPAVIANVNKTAGPIAKGTKTAAPMAKANSLAIRTTLVGWAFDGFPVYWKYGQLKKDGDVITMKSGWTLKKAREAGSDPVPDVKKFPLGTFVNDYQYTEGTGDDALDECNGKECYSPALGRITYCYFITDKFPYIPRCFRGTPTEK